MSNVKVTEIDYYITKIRNTIAEYLKPATELPEQLALVSNPRNKKFWFAEGKNNYRCFCYLEGQWWEYKEIQFGFYDFHVPRHVVSLEAYKCFLNLKSQDPELFKRFSKVAQKDLDFWCMVEYTRKTMFNTKKRFAGFVKKNK